MRLRHHHDDDKEFSSWKAPPYDEGMFIALVLQVALAFQEPPPIADTVIRTAVNEAAAIWAPYGLALEHAAACDTAQFSTLVLAVDVEGRDRRSSCRRRRRRSSARDDVGSGPGGKRKDRHIRPALG
jgi:hypothetical protein